MENELNNNLDEAYLVGLVIGDGCISPISKSMSITNNDKEIIDFCKKYDVWIQSKKRASCKEIRFKKNFIEYF